MLKNLIIKCSDLVNRDDISLALKNTSSLDEIENQINEVKKGNVTDEEFNQAKEVLLNDLSSVDDTLFGTLNMIKTYHNFNKEFDLKEEINKFNNVSKQDVIDVCKLLTYCNYAVLDKE